ncbi:hypothetical protein L218DRAFT_402466 [Marasmius fiardii PR-910]|nr:hypothetical protein L218DRAFT_402466 [Marasmius fiardii PR-910]
MVVHILALAFLLSTKCQNHRPDITYVAQITCSTTCPSARLVLRLSYRWRVLPLWYSEASILFKYRYSHTDTRHLHVCQYLKWSRCRMCRLSFTGFHWIYTPVDRCSFFWIANVYPLLAYKIQSIGCGVATWKFNWPLSPSLFTSNVTNVGCVHRLDGLKIQQCSDFSRFYALGTTRTHLMDTKIPYGGG